MRKLKSSAQRGGRFVRRPGPARRTNHVMPAGAGFNQPPMAAAGLLPAPLAAMQPSVKWQVPGGAGFGLCFERGMVGQTALSC